MTREAVISVRLPKTVKAAIEAAAEHDRRPVANLVAYVLELWLIENGYMPKPERPPRTAKA